MLFMPLGLIANPPPKRLQTTPVRKVRVTREDRFIDDSRSTYVNERDTTNEWNDEERFILKTVIVFAAMSLLPLVVFLLIQWFHPEWLLFDITPSSTAP